MNRTTKARAYAVAHGAMEIASGSALIWLTRAALVALVALFSLPARADSQSSTAAANKKADVLKLKVPGDIQTDKAGPSKSKFPIGSEDVARDALAEQKRDQEIEEIKRILPHLQEKAPQRADLYFQLAELYWEKSRYAALQEVKVYDDTYAKWLAEVQKRDNLFPEADYRVYAS